MFFRFVASELFSMFTKAVQPLVSWRYNKRPPIPETALSLLEDAPYNMLCFIALFGTGNYTERSKKWNLFSFSNLKTFYLGQTLIFAPWLRSRISNFTLSCSEVALQAGRLQRTTSGIIIKILLKVTMVTAC